MLYTKSSIFLVIGALGLLFGCGGGGGSSSPAPAPQPSNPPTTGTTTDVVRGQITGFGSVFVDGTRFATDNARFIKDDDDAEQDDFRIGMVVEIEGDLDDGRADVVRFEEDVKGPVDAVGVDNLTVLGQTVAIRPDTHFDDNLTLADILVGDILEVSGLRDADDVIEASFIEREDGVDTYKVIGTARNVDVTSRTFSIGGLSIDYSVARLDDLDTITDGMLLEVKDANTAYSPGDFTLIATKIEPVDQLNDEADRQVRLQGLITVIVNGNQFQINGVIVRHGAGTTFRFGAVDLLAPGTKIEVEGVVAADGSIDATRIKFARNSARIEAQIDAVDLDTEQLVVFGIDVALLPGAELEDDCCDDADLTVADLRPGDFVEIRGTSAGDVVFASELERDDLDETRIRGPATEVDAEARALHVLGVPIVTSANTRYEAIDDTVLDAAAFFALLADGQTLVQAQWDEPVTDATVAVAELSLED